MVKKEIMRILLIGGTSLVGRYLTLNKPRKTEELICTYNSGYVPYFSNLKMDITNISETEETIRFLNPDVIILCAGMGDVDLCSKNPANSHMVNVVACNSIVTVCNRLNIKLVYMSTNAVYNTSKGITELSVPFPINLYGRQKLKAEKYIQTVLDDYMIVRPQFLYGVPVEGRRDNWIHKIINSLNENEPLRLVDDVQWQATHAGDLATIIWNLIYDNYIGTINISAARYLDLYTMGKIIAEKLGVDIGLINRASIYDFSQLEARPLHTVYNTERVNRMGYHCKDFPDGLDELLKEMI